MSPRHQSTVLLIERGLAGTPEGILLAIIAKPLHQVGMLLWHERAEQDEAQHLIDEALLHFIAGLGALGVGTDPDRP